MREVKLLKIVEETVLCERDHIVCRYLDNDSWTPVGDGEALNTKLSLKQRLVPITKYCKLSPEGQERHMYPQGYRDPDEPYVHTAYVAIDHHNSEFFVNWINKQEEFKDYYYTQWNKAESKIIDLKFLLKTVQKASFWKRLKWLFTGVQID